ncbi:MAG: hypothetical protein R2759_14840 [Bacteroidales bacterium]
MSVSIDITYVVSAISELTQAKNKAEEVDRLKTAFLANMSHDQNPDECDHWFFRIAERPDLTSQNRAEFVKLIGENSRTAFLIRRYH